MTYNVFAGTLNLAIYLCVVLQVPFATMLALLCMWMGISVPLVFLGYFFGFRKEVTSVTECLTSDIFSMLLCGVSDCIIVFSIVLAP